MGLALGAGLAAGCYSSGPFAYSNEFHTLHSWSAHGAAAVLAFDGMTFQALKLEGAYPLDAEGLLADGGACVAPGPWWGMIVLCRRDGRSFAEKAENVRLGGGLAAVIYNEPAQGLLHGQLDGPAPIPVIAISGADGEAALRRVGQPAEVKVERLMIVEQGTLRDDQFVKNPFVPCTLKNYFPRFATAPGVVVAIVGTGWAVSEAQKGPADLAVAIGVTALLATPFLLLGIRESHLKSGCKESAFAWERDHAKIVAPVLSVPAPGATPAPFSMRRPHPEAGTPCRNPMPGVPNTGQCPKGLFCRGTTCVGPGTLEP